MKNKEEQKQHLIDMMKGDEELGLYDESREIKVEDIFNDEKRENIKKFIDEIKNPSEPNQALKDAAERYSKIYRCPATNDNEYCKHDIISAFNNGAKWQQERSYSEEDLKLAFEAGHKKGFSGYPNTENWKELPFKEWFEQFKKK